MALDGALPGAPALNRAVRAVSALLSDHDGLAGYGLSRPHPMHRAMPNTQVDTAMAPGRYAEVPAGDPDRDLPADRGDYCGTCRGEPRLRASHQSRDGGRIAGRGRQEKWLPISLGATGTLREAGATARIPVAVHAPDPISFAGAVSQLSRQPAVELVEEGSDRPGLVAVLVADTLDQPTLSRLRRLVRADGARVVLVAGLIREADLLDVIECGVGAIVWRHEATGHRLLQAVLAASRGDGDLPGDLLGRLINQVGTLQRGAAAHPHATAAGLTHREVNVLRLVAEGMDTAEIASKLSYSERTVKNVMHAITMRLQLRNRAHAVAYALKEGYI